MSERLHCRCNDGSTDVNVLGDSQDKDGDWIETGLHIFFGAYPNMMNVFRCIPHQHAPVDISAEKQQLWPATLRHSGRQETSSQVRKGFCGVGEVSRAPVSGKKGGGGGSLGQGRGDMEHCPQCMQFG